MFGKTSLWAVREELVRASWEVYGVGFALLVCVCFNEELNPLQLAIYFPPLDSTCPGHAASPVVFPTPLIAMREAMPEAKGVWPP